MASAACEQQMPFAVFSSELRVEPDSRSGDFTGTLTVRNRNQGTVPHVAVSFFTIIGPPPATPEKLLGTVTFAPNETKTWRFPIKVPQIHMSQKMIRVGATVKPAHADRSYSYVQVDFRQDSSGGSAKSGETVVRP